MAPRLTGFRTGCWEPETWQAFMGDSKLPGHVPHFRVFEQALSLIASNRPLSNGHRLPLVAGNAFGFTVNSLLHYFGRSERVNVCLPKDLSWKEMRRISSWAWWPFTAPSTEGRLMVPMSLSPTSETPWHLDPLNRDLNIGDAPARRKR